MARQPFLPAHKGKSYAIGARVIEQHPEFVSAVGRCLTLWPYVEHQLGILLGILLKAETGAAVAIFRRLRSVAMQRDVLGAAAVSLKPDETALFRAVLRLFESTAKERADLAHGHWGVLDGEPDKVLWIEAKDHSPWNALVLLAEARGQHIGHEQLQEDLFVYTMRDIEEIYAHILELWMITFDLVGLFRGSTAKGQYRLVGPDLLKHLISLPRVAQFLPKS
jgi:hypothetical protein